MPSFKQAPYGGSPTTQRKRPNIDPLFGRKKKTREKKDEKGRREGSDDDDV